MKMSDMDRYLENRGFKVVRNYRSVSNSYEFAISRGENTYTSHFETEIFNWYNDHKDYMKLSDGTRKIVEKILKDIKAKLEEISKEEAHTTILDENDKPKDQIVHFNALAIGENDHGLMKKLVNGGPVHAKFRRMIAVYADITAPLYWWKEFDTYKVGTVANSCSTMHKIHDKEFEMSDFSFEHLNDSEYVGVNLYPDGLTPITLMKMTVDMLNYYRRCFIEDGKTKDDWWQMIQLLPSSYNQKRTVMLNYEVLANIYEWRKNHKLDEWREFCEWIETLPYSEIITGGKSDG